MGFGVWGLGFGVWGLGFGVWGLGFGVWGFGIRDSGFVFRFSVFGFRFSVFGFRVSGVFRVRVEPEEEAERLDHEPHRQQQRGQHPVRCVHLRRVPLTNRCRASFRDCVKSPRSFYTGFCVHLGKVNQVMHHPRSGVMNHTDSSSGDSTRYAVFTCGGCPSSTAIEPTWNKQEGQDQMRSAS